MNELLNKLYKNYGLSKDDVFINPRFKIITRSGIDKIMAKRNIRIEYEFVEKLCESLFSSVLNKWLTSVVVVASATDESSGKSLITTGEANNDNVKQNPPYMIAMAEKRAKSRAVLMLAGLYEEGFYGEDEAPAFSEEIRKSADNEKGNGNPSIGGVQRKKAIYKG